MPSSLNETFYTAQFPLPGLTEEAPGTPSLPEKPISIDLPSTFHTAKYLTNDEEHYFDERIRTPPHHTPIINVLKKALQTEVGNVVQLFAFPTTFVALLTALQRESAITAMETGYAVTASRPRFKHLSA